MQQGESNKIDELQRLLSDERSRCNQHKQVYQALKEKYGSLETELQSIYEQLKDATEQNNVIKTSKDSYIKKLEQTVKKKQDEINNLSEKILHADQDKFKDQFLSDTTKRFSETLTQLQTESDELREKYNHLHYDYTVLKGQKECLETEHKQELNLLTVQHDSELREFKVKIESLERESDAPVRDYSTELRASEKEVLQLNLRVKTLHSEIQELRAQNEKISMQMDRNARTHSKQLNEHLANIRILESEKATAIMQKDILQKELSSNQEEKNSLNIRLQDMKQQILELSSELEDSKYKYDLDMADLKLQQQKVNIEHEAMKDELKEEIEHIKGEADSLKKDINLHLQLANEKEQVMQQHLITTKQQTLRKITEIDQEKDRLQQKCSEIESTKNEEIAQFKLQLESLKHNLENALQQKTALEQELVILRTKLGTTLGQDSIHSDLLKQNEEFRKEMQSMKNQLNQLVSDESAEYRRFDGAKKYEDSSYQEMIQLRLTLEQQKHEYQQRIDGLESQLMRNNKTWSDEKKDIQNKLKQYARLITKLREKLDIEKSHLEEVEVQNEILKKNVPLEDHLQLKKKLLDLRRKQEEFHQVMVAALPCASSFSPVPPSHAERKLPFSPLPTQASFNGLTDQNQMSDVVDNLLKQAEPGELKTPKSRFRPRRKKSKTLLKSETSKIAMHRHSSSSDIENL